jgi:AcrR family transcriptional regulator
MTKNTRVPKQKRAAQTKHNIILAAITLFSKNGYYATNSKEIARQAGVATGSFYAYFKDKREVLYAAFDYYNRRIFDAITDFHAKANYGASDPRSVLTAMVQNALKAHKIFPDFHREISSLMIADHGLAKNLELYFDSGVKMTEEILFAYKDKVRVTDMKTSSVLITRMVEDFVHFLVFDKPALDHERLMKEFIEMLYRYLFR